MRRAPAQGLETLAEHMLGVLTAAGVGQRPAIFVRFPAPPSPPANPIAIKRYEEALITGGGCASAHCALPGDQIWWCDRIRRSRALRPRIRSCAIGTAIRSDLIRIRLAPAQVGHSMGGLLIKTMLARADESCADCPYAPMARAHRRPT